MDFSHNFVSKVVFVMTVRHIISYKLCYAVSIMIHRKFLQLRPPFFIATTGLLSFEVLLSRSYYFSTLCEHECMWVCVLCIDAVKLIKTLICHLLYSRLKWIRQAEAERQTDERETTHHHHHSCNVFKWPNVLVIAANSTAHTYNIIKHSRKWLSERFTLILVWNDEWAWCASSWLRT